MLESSFILLGVAFLIIAAFFSVTGHGGASAYIAVMVLLSMSPQEIRPIALSLNIIVSLVATIQFYSAGHFRRTLFFPVIFGSVPFALIGGYLQLSTQWFNLLLGLVLIFAALNIAIRPAQALQKNAPKFSLIFMTGAVIGLLSGLIGVGGGIFLTPLLLLMGWAAPRQAAAVTAPFILLNSISGLVGFSLQATNSFPSAIIWLALPVLVGGLFGSYLGSRSLPVRSITLVLSAVLLIAGLKLLYV